METPDWVKKFCHRWQKRIFPNDIIESCPSVDPVLSGGWDVSITRAGYQSILTLNPDVFGNPRMDNHILLDADKAMRSNLKQVKSR